ncbi:hypothetical protein B0G57_10161 [Trinickia symbiotica]|uniref:DUF3592 domain-containing protein n=1 Tax=Trinickia symbiotica TaxID=863227 RepID=A0A2N7X903_9BURK|nr:hypothetical protein [Trinickia symbiotica]PMS38208.1 hypothetical protein C0Z20_05390 [Trinickia symbiotica]PPK47097.1 hypothetical protein B0G57_10161 [Trinickia symbiotica]
MFTFVRKSLHASSRLLLFLMLMFVGLLSFGGGCSGLFNAALLLKARNWPITEARLERCDPSLSQRKNGEYYWRLFATWRYGEGMKREYSDLWSPNDAPTYPASSDSAVVDAHDRAAIIARYCSSLASTQLRASLTHPSWVVRNDAAERGEWKRELSMGIAAIFFGLFPMGFSLLVLLVDERKDPRYQNTIRRCFSKVMQLVVKPR